MTALNFSYAYIKDNDKFKQYLKEAAILMEGEDIEVVVLGGFAKTIQGDNCTPHIAAVFRYPDRATAEKLYSSEKYKTLISLRDEACVMTIMLYDEWDK